MRNISELSGLLFKGREKWREEKRRVDENRSGKKRCGTNGPEIEVGSRDSVAPRFHFISLSCGPHNATRARVDDVTGEKNVAKKILLAASRVLANVYTNIRSCVRIELTELRPLISTLCERAKERKKKKEKKASRSKVVIIFRYRVSVDKMQEIIEVNRRGSEQRCNWIVHRWREPAGRKRSFRFCFPHSVRDPFLITIGR